MCNDFQSHHFYLLQAKFAAYWDYKTETGFGFESMSYKKSC